MSITMSILDENDLLHYGEVYENLHNRMDVLMKVFGASTNILLNNFCKKENNDIAASKLKTKI